MTDYVGIALSIVCWQMGILMFVGLNVAIFVFIKDIIKDLKELK